MDRHHIRGIRSLGSGIPPAPLLVLHTIFYTLFAVSLVSFACGRKPIMVTSNRLVGIGRSFRTTGTVGLNTLSINVLLFDWFLTRLFLSKKRLSEAMGLGHPG
ncbi:hypothetical protein B0T20DRAFT_69357 [Sordaria brevicollis]|uniref:Uncharacterized protein n=1 Tax=Sordaria brevicollis TaxID=83679 RepID=A0AAE0P220_SORBR|nr:hypothetical protein B0T20DRAFT_69357 [Sordaria brevicollis]